MRTLFPMERGQELELVALAVHSRFVGVVVLQMCAFGPHTTVLAKPWPEPAAMVQVVHRKLLLWTRTSF